MRLVIGFGVILAAIGIVLVSGAASPECDALPTNQQLTCRLLSWGASSGVLSPTQLQSLNAQLPALIAELPAAPAASDSATATAGGGGKHTAEGFFSSSLRTVREGFSVMNVLYGIGGIIVVLAMSFLLALAYQTMGGFGIFGIGLGYAVAFAFAGRALFRNEEYALAGAILFTLSELMTVVWVFGIQMITNVASRGGGGSRDELMRRARPIAFAVLLVGSCCFAYTRHWLTTVPMSLAWIVLVEVFIALKISNLPRRWEMEQNWRVVAGLISSVVVYALQQTVLSSADSVAVSRSLTVLYFATSGQFWIGLTFRDPPNVALGFLYLFINIGLIVVSSRVSFLLAIFGGIGVVAYHIAILFRYDAYYLVNVNGIIDWGSYYTAPTLRTALIFVRYFIMTGLMGYGLDVYPPFVPAGVVSFVSSGGNIFVVAVCAISLIAQAFFYFFWVVDGPYTYRNRAPVVGGTLANLKWPLVHESLSLLHVFVSAMLFVAVEQSLNITANAQWSIWFVTVDVRWLFRWLVLLQCGMHYAPHAIATKAAFATPNERLERVICLMRFGLAFGWIRFGGWIITHCVPFLFTAGAAPILAGDFFPPLAAAVYGVSLIVYRESYVQYNAPELVARRALVHFKSFVWNLAVLVLAYEFDSNWLYYVAVADIAYMNQNYKPEPRTWQVVYVLHNIILIVVSVLFGFNLALVLGCITLFKYLAFLAHRVFAGSLLFPIVLSAMGLGLIYSGVQYQKHAPMLHAYVVAYHPERYAFLMSSLSLGWAVVVSVLYTLVPASKLLNLLGSTAAPIDLTATPRLVLASCKSVWGPASPPPESKPHGIILKFYTGFERVENENDSSYGLKRPELNGLLMGTDRQNGSTCQLRGHVLGESFWQSMSDELGSFAVSGFQFAVMPLSLNTFLPTPNQANGHAYDSGAFSFELGTGINSSQRVGQDTLRRILGKLATTRGDPSFMFVVTFESTIPNARIHRGVLCSVRLKPSQLLASDDSNLLGRIQPLRPRNVPQAPDAPAATATNTSGRRVPDAKWNDGVNDKKLRRATSSSGSSATPKAEW